MQQCGLASAFLTTSPPPPLTHAPHPHVPHPHHLPPPQSMSLSGQTQGQRREMGPTLSGSGFRRDLCFGV
uniref:Uncharacterized protein n=1 Tax=Knipowitschia caucasica TaxID=637954 RepID=A0AAV2L866_KNICA